LFNGKAKHIPGLIGLIACGGNSSRMGMDKSMLIYQHKPEVYRLYELLEIFCETVLISCNANQAAGIDSSYNCCPDLDCYANNGPIAGLLSAFTNVPGNNILLIGCDYPFLDADCLQGFAAFIQHENKPAAFYNEKEQLFEPLLAFYPFHECKQLKERYHTNQLSLQHYLKSANARKYIPANEKCMTSIDTYSDYINTKMYFETNTAT